MQHATYFIHHYIIVNYCMHYMILLYGIPHYILPHNLWTTEIIPFTPFFFFVQWLTDSSFILNTQFTI